MFDFDAWRSRYDQMDAPQQVVEYSRIFEAYPEQRQYDSTAVLRSVELVTPEDVLEIGGWRGELAAEILATREGICSWVNLEICHEAAMAPRCDDLRFTSVSLTEFPWDMDLFQSDMLLMSHSAEHMRAEQLERLIVRSKPRSIYIDAPLPAHRMPDWSGYGGTHILELSWSALVALIESHGYEMSRTWETKKGSSAKLFRMT